MAVNGAAMRLVSLNFIKFFVGKIFLRGQPLNQVRIIQRHYRLDEEQAG
jgi:hypothetical protein